MTVRIVAFDLDDTLAPSKSALPAEVGAALERLLHVSDVCVISGGKWEQFTTQLLSNLPEYGRERLHLMPTCGTRYLRWVDGEWTVVYESPLPAQVRERVIGLVEREAKRLGLWADQHWGDIIEDRGTQITFSALGQQAPLAAKRDWDPTGEKRVALKNALAPLLPGLEVRAGGSTSVDITQAGVDKAFGIRELSERTGVPLADMVFVGDRLDPDGNDRPVMDLGVRCVATTGPEQTPLIIDDIIEQIA